MQKEQRLKYIDALIKEVNAWPIISPRVVINNFIEKAQLQIAKIIGPQSPYIKEIDVFNNGKEAIDYDINIKNVLKKIRFDIDSEEEINNTISNNIPSEKTVEQGKIFISHSSKDHDLVHKFIDHVLILGLGVKREEIFCTSVDGLGIKSGEDFKKAIHVELTNAKTVIQIITKNYKTSEVCLNEMGAAWVMKSKVIPLVASPFNFDVGFIHASTQQLKLNDEKDLLKLHDDHKETTFNSNINISNYLKQIKIFLDFATKYSTHDEIKKERAFFYIEENKIYGKLSTAIFGHPPMERFEDSTSFHPYYFVELEFPIDVLSRELLIREGNANVSYFNLQRIHIVKENREQKINLKEFVGKNVEVTGQFMGGHTAWHRTEVLMFFTNIKEIN